MQAQRPIQPSVEDVTPAESSAPMIVPFATSNVIGLFVPTSMPRPATSPASAPS